MMRYQYFNKQWLKWWQKAFICLLLLFRRYPKGIRGRWEMQFFKCDELDGKKIRQSTLLIKKSYLMKKMFSIAAAAKTNLMLWAEHGEIKLKKLSSCFSGWSEKRVMNVVRRKKFVFLSILIRKQIVETGIDLRIKNTWNLD